MHAPELKEVSEKTDVVKNLDARPIPVLLFQLFKFVVNEPD
jgi:hypothetical protein